MPLFLCDKCGVIENTALSGYWARSMRDGGTGEALCSLCDKGEWHGKFPREFMTDDQIAEQASWSGWVSCDRLDAALNAHLVIAAAERQEKEAARKAATELIYPDRIRRMPNGSKSQRKAKHRAKQLFAAQGNESM